MADTVETLTRLGFSEYEAKAYIALLQHGPLNGYELARESKLPRANVYNVLEKLEDRGAVTRLETPSGTRYVPIQPEELTRRLGSRLQAALDDAQESLKALGTAIAYEPVMNAHGYAALLEHAQSLLDDANKTLLIAIYPEESLALQRSLEEAASRGVEITTLCLEPCQVECGRCRGHVFRYHVAPGEDDRWLIVVRDGEELLGGLITPAKDAQSARTRQRLMVDLASGYIRRSIALAVLLDELKDSPEGMLTAHGRNALITLNPGQAGDDWMDHLRGLFPRDQASS